jgi:hypothetical protein
VIDDINLSQYVTENLYYASFSYDFMVETCTPSTMSNCSVQKDVSTCEQCETGYYVDSSGSCTRQQYSPIENCENYINNFICDLCVDGFYLDRNECKARTTIENCELYYKDLDKCDNCKTGYTVSNDKSQCAPQTPQKIANCFSESGDLCATCLDGYIKSDDNKKCFQEVENCVEYEPQNADDLYLRCKACEDIYMPNSIKDRCVGSQLQNCYEGTSKCKVCDAEYVLNKNTLFVASECILRNTLALDQYCRSNKGDHANSRCEDCLPGYSVIQKQRAIKSEEFMTTCEEVNQKNGECIQCPEDHHGIENQCVSGNSSASCLQLKKNYIGTEIDENCAKCKDETRHYLEDSRCVPRTYSSPNCEKYDSTKDRCHICKEGFLPPSSSKLKDFTICELFPDNVNRIENCIAYNSEYKCDLCAKGYIVSLSGLSCRETSNYSGIILDANLIAVGETLPQNDVDNCERYQQIDQSTVGCVKCLEGYVGILKFENNKLSNRVHFDSITKDLKAEYDQCVSYTKWVEFSEDSTANIQFCESGIFEFKNEEFTCLSCKLGYNSLIGYHLDTVFNVSLFNALAVRGCEKHSDKEKRFFGLGGHYLPSFPHLPLGTLLTFDTCTDENLLLSVNHDLDEFGRAKIEGNPRETQELASCLPKPSNYDENCQIFSRLEDEANRKCLACKPGYSKSSSDTGLQFGKCEPIPYCAESNFGVLLNGCLNPSTSFILDDDGILRTNILKRSVGGIQNCSAYDSNDNCVLCKAGFSLTSGQCINITLISSYNCEKSGFGSHNLPRVTSNKQFIQNMYFLNLFIYNNDEPSRSCGKCKNLYENIRDTTNEDCQAGQGDASDNCKLYFSDYPIKCAICNNGYIANLSTGQCLPQSSYPSCLELSGEAFSECTKCEENMIWEFGKCQASNCAKMHNGKCTLCNDGYTFQQTSDKMCVLNTNSSDPCLAYSPSKKTCGKCKDDKLLFIIQKTLSDPLTFVCDENTLDFTSRGWTDLNLEDYYIEKIINFEDSVFRSFGGSFILKLSFFTSDELEKKVYNILSSSTTFSDSGCFSHRVIENCSELSEDGIECLSCKDSFILNKLNHCVDSDSSDCIDKENSLCVNCSSGHYLSNGICYDYSPGMNCATFNKTKNECATCPENYQLNNQSICEQSPDTTDPGCVSYENPNSCKECKEEYLLNQETKKCDLREAENCQTVEPLEDQCKVCADNNYKDSSDNNCKPYTIVQFCENYESEQDKCKDCQEGYYPLNTTCAQVPTPILNCLYYKNDTECKKCKTDFFLNNNECRQGNISNCSEYETENICKKCKEGFYLESNTQCTAYSEDLNCKTFSPSSDECSDCNNNFFLDENKKCIERDPTLNCKQSVENQNKCISCNDDRWLDEASGKCQERTVTNCKTFNLSADQCLTCNGVFVLNSESKKCEEGSEIEGCLEYTNNKKGCFRCNKGYFWERLKCTPNPDGIVECKTYSDLNTCQECNLNFYLANNECKAVTTRVANCEKHKNETECEACKNEFHLSSPTSCQSNDISNCKEQFNSTICKTCNTNFVLQREGNKLICVESNINNCVLPVGGRVTTCLKCAEGYVPSSDKQSCIVPEGIQECESYKTFNSCSRCKSGFVRNSTCSECIERQSVTGSSLVHTHCLSEVIEKEPICNVCKPGYTKNIKGECVACKSHGCAICNLETGGCRICAEGFYMKQDMACHLKSGVETVDKSA